MFFFREDYTLSRPPHPSTVRISEDPNIVLIPYRHYCWVGGPPNQKEVIVLLSMGSYSIRSRVTTRTGGGGGVEKNLHREHTQNHGSSALGTSSVRNIWEFRKIRTSFLGVSILRIIVFGGLYWGPLILGNYNFE